jgi:hypothetical protein
LSKDSPYWLKKEKKWQREIRRNDRPDGEKSEYNDVNDR